MLHRTHRAAVLIALALWVCGTGCGWRTGGAPIGALSVGEVRGVAQEPGLRGAIGDGVVGALRSRGVRSGGPTVVLQILTSDDQPAATASSSQDTTVWRAVLEVRGAVEGRTGCEVVASGERLWSLSSTTPREGSAERAQAHATLARYVAERVVDGLFARPECR